MISLTLLIRVSTQWPAWPQLKLKQQFTSIVFLGSQNKSTNLTQLLSSAKINVFGDESEAFFVFLGTDGVSLLGNWSFALFEII